MPLYSLQCLKCDKEFEDVSTVKERVNILCSCGGRTKRLITAKSKPVVLEYFSENAQLYFTGPKQRDRLLKEKNLAQV